MATLLTRAFPFNVRGIERVLWVSARSSRGRTLDLTEETKQALPPLGVRNLPTTAMLETMDAAETTDPVLEPKPREIPVPTRENLVDALERCDWVQERAWRELDLSSRYQLRRLMQKYGVASPSADADFQKVPSAKRVCQVLRECDGVQERAWVVLGLKNRYALRRLIRQYGLVDEVDRDEFGE